MHTTHLSGCIFKCSCFHDNDACALSGNNSRQQQQATTSATQKHKKQIQNHET